LTSFVLRSFSQARQFVFIDDKEIQSIRKWVESKQLNNGCFKKHGTLLRKELKVLFTDELIGLTDARFAIGGMLIIFNLATK